MKELIRAEVLKLSRSLGYRVLLLCALCVGLLMGGAFILLANIEFGYRGYGGSPGGFMMDIFGMNGHFVYINALSDLQVPAILISVFAALFVSSEFGNRTHALGIQNGCTRQGILLAKAIVFLVGVLPLVFTIPFVSALTMSIFEGFGTPLNAETLLGLIQYTALFFLGHITLASICFLLAILTKNVIGTIGAGVGIFLTLGFLSQLATFLESVESVMRFIFVHQLGQLPNLESIPMFLFGCIAFGTGALALAFDNFQKADLA